MSICNKKKDMCLLAGSSDFYLDEKVCIDECFVIALDGGYESLLGKGITPDVIIGDFDSLGYVPDVPNVTVLPRVKDDTDSFYAATWALSEGYRRFYLCGCTGGKREDHTFANVALMQYLARRGAECVMEGEGQMYRVISGPAHLCFEANKGYFSVFSLTEQATGIVMRGFEYETDEITLKSEVPLGVSNSFASDKCEIEVKEGDLLLIWQK